MESLQAYGTMLAFESVPLVFLETAIQDAVTCSAGASPGAGASAGKQRTLQCVGHLCGSLYVVVVVHSLSLSLSLFLLHTHTH